MISIVKPVCRSLMVVKPVVPESKIVKVFKETIVLRPILDEGVCYGYIKEKIKIYNDPKP